MRSLFEQASAENRMQFAGPPVMALMRLSKGLLPHTVLRAPPAYARTVRAQCTSHACPATQSAATPNLLNSIWGSKQFCVAAGAGVLGSTRCAVPVSNQRLVAHRLPGTIQRRIMSPSRCTHGNAYVAALIEPGPDIHREALSEPSVGTNRCSSHAFTCVCCISHALTCVCIRFGFPTLLLRFLPLHYQHAYSA